MPIAESQNYRGGGVKKKEGEIGGKVFSYLFRNKKNPGKTPKHQKLDPETDRGRAEEKETENRDGKLERGGE